MKPETDMLYSFAAFGIFTITITYFFIPDYTGRSHAQIDELFSRKIPARKVRGITEEHFEYYKVTDTKFLYSSGRLCALANTVEIFYTRRREPHRF